MEKDTKDDVLQEINNLRLAIKEFLRPEVLTKFADLLDQMGYAERYVYFSTRSSNGKDCRYARMAKEAFLEENENNVVNLITWLYENWAKNVKTEK